jgi:hypothetical protein
MLCKLFADTPVWLNYSTDAGIAGNNHRPAILDSPEDVHCKMLHCRA